LFAALVTGKKQLELREMPDPTPEEGKVVVDVACCGICGTDLHAYASGDPYNPAICGHEWSGSVSGVGKGVEGLKEGDRVGVGTSPACGQCAECRSGDAAHCQQSLISMLGIGPFHTPHGGFAPSIAVDARRLYPVRDELSDIEGAMLEPATVTVHAVRRMAMRLGDTAVVLGAGPIGLLTLQCAKAAGAGRLVVVEPDPLRARLAVELGADVAVDPRTESVEERVREECGAVGPDVVLECAGIPSTVNQAAELVRRGGAVALVGLATVPAEIVPMTWLAKEVRLIASLGSLREEFDITMQLVADGRLKLAPLHTSTVGLEDIAPAFDRLLGLDDEVKILVDPRQ
jgi:(R,R)-butanediol dehydrogenase/meso-butanediol dehydrogenase/diacetyl reductase